MGAHGRASLRHETHWRTRAAHRALRTAAWAYYPSRRSQAPAFRDLYEGSASTLPVTPAESRPGCLMVSKVPVCVKKTGCLGTWTRSVAVGGCRCAADTFSGYGVAVPVCSANSSHSLAALETNLGHVCSFLGHLQSDRGVPFIAEGAPQWTGSQGVRRLSLLPATYGDGLVKSKLSAPFLSPPQFIDLSRAVCSLTGCPQKEIIRPGPRPDGWA